MGWQDRFRELGERLTSGEIGTDEYRRLSEAILAEADREAAGRAATDREAVVDGQKTAPIRPRRVPIPTSAAWEAPSGEMTQIVGTRDETTVVGAVGDVPNDGNEAEN